MKTIQSTKVYPEEIVVKIAVKHGLSVKFTEKVFRECIKEMKMHLLSGKKVVLTKLATLHLERKKSKSVGEHSVLYANLSHTYKQEINADAPALRARIKARNLAIQNDPITQRTTAILNEVRYKIPKQA